MDTMVMAVRVALLVLTTGTFAALWTGDHPDRISNIDRPRRELMGQQSRRPDSPNSGHRINLMTTPSGIQVSDARRFDIPLPRGIAAGTYLVVDQFGGTSVRVVSQQESSAAGQRRSPKADDHYSSRIGMARWHFVRIDDSLTKQTAAVPNTANSLH